MHALATFNDKHSYLNTILQKSEKFLEQEFKGKDLDEFYQNIEHIFALKNKKHIISEFEKCYYAFVKKRYQNKYKYDKNLEQFLDSKTPKIIWGDCLESLKLMKSESVGAMVTSPPYYNARTYAKYNDLNEYLNSMEEILKECYRVLDNHRVFVFNVGDIFDQSFYHLDLG